MCMRMYACAHVRVYAYMYVYVYVHVCMLPWMYALRVWYGIVCMPVRVSVYGSVCMHVCMHECMHACAYVCCPMNAYMRVWVYAIRCGCEYVRVCACVCMLDSMCVHSSICLAACM